MKISSGWRICYCNTRGLTSRCQRGDIRGAGQELGLCISRRGGKQAFSSGLPAGLEAASWHITQAPEAGRVLAAASGPPSRSPGRFHHENKGTFWDNKQTCEFCREQKKNKICTFQAMENANCFYSSTSIPGVLCSQPKGTDLQAMNKMKAVALNSYLDVCSVQLWKPFGFERPL